MNHSGIARLIAVVFLALSLSVIHASGQIAAAVTLPGTIVYDTPGIGDNDYFTIEKPHIVYTVNPDGSNQKKVVEGTSPIFSLDGTRIAYVRQEGNSAQFKSILISAKLDGSDAQPLCTVEPNLLVTLKRWSPRGTFIAFSTTGNGTDGYQELIYICNTRTKIASPAPQVAGSHVRGIYDWNADESAVLWHSGPPGDYNLYYGTPGDDETKITNVTNGLYRISSNQDGMLYADAQISPDGKTIAVLGSKLFFVSVPGQNSPLNGKAIADGSDIWRVVWSPNSKALALVQIKEHSTQLQVIDLSGQQIPGTVVVQNVNSLDWTRPTSAALPPSTTTASTVPQKPTKLVFQQQPVGGLIGENLKTQPVIAVEDANGLTLPEYIGSVTVTLKEGTGSPGTELSGTTTELINAGQATFTDLKVTVTGENYELTASIGDLTADSTPFTIFLPSALPPGVPNLDGWDTDDLYTKGLVDNGSDATHLQFSIGRYYGLVDATGRLIDADCKDQICDGRQDLQRNYKLHDQLAELYLWLGTGAPDPTKITLTVNSTRPQTFEVHPSGIGGLVHFPIFVGDLRFPDICTRNRSHDFNCLRNPNVANYPDDQPDSSSKFLPIQSVTNTLTISGPNGQINAQASYLFLNGVRPVLLMSGIDFNIPSILGDKDHPGGEVKNTTGDWLNWLNWLTDLGIPSWNVPRNGTEDVFTQFVYILNGAKFLNEKYGVKKFNLIAHSMGGVVSRYYIAQSAFGFTPFTVDKLITLDSPQTGLPIAGTNIPLLAPYYLAQLELGTEQMKKFNASYDNRFSWINGGDPAYNDSHKHIYFVSYPSLAAPHVCVPIIGCSISVGPLERIDMDGFVPNMSAIGQDYPDGNNNLSTNDSFHLPANYTSATISNDSSCVIHDFYDFQGRELCHGAVLHSSSIKDEIIADTGIARYSANWLPAPDPNTSAFLAQSALQSERYSFDPTAVPTSTQSSGTLLTSTIILTGSTPIKVPLVADVVSDLHVTVGSTVSGAKAKVRIADTQGKVIMSDQDTPGTFVFNGTSFPPGHYTIILTPTSLPAPTLFEVQVTGNSNVTAQVHLVPATADTARKGTITNSLLAGLTPITNATVTATLTLSPSTGSSRTAKVSLHDDGTNGDATANDGIYSAAMPDGLTNEIVVANVVAQGTVSGQAFTRESADAIQTQNGQLVFNGLYSWQPTVNSASASAQTDAAFLNIGVSTQQTGVYRVEAALAAANGQTVASTSLTRTLPSGKTSLQLRFDASQIERSQLDGPYHVSILRAWSLDGTTSSESDTLENTSVVPPLTLNRSQLARPQIRRGGVLTVSSITTDSTGGFQKAQTTLPLDVAKTNTYTYSAVLRTPKGTTLSTVRGQTTLAAGQKTPLLLIFNSTATATNEKAPYQVEDVTIADIKTGSVLLYIPEAGTLDNLAQPASPEHGSPTAQSPTQNQSDSGSNTAIWIIVAVCLIAASSAGIIAWRQLLKKHH